MKKVLFITGSSFSSASTPPTPKNYPVNLTQEELFLLYWAVGLIEAEGYIGFNSQGKNSTTWVFTIKVAMLNNNRRAVHKLKSIMKAGKIHEDNSNMVVWKINDRKKIIAFIIPLLEIFPPRGVKYYDYVIFKEALIVADDTNLTTEEKHQKLTELKEKSKIIKEVSPIVSNNPEDWTKEAKDVIQNIDVEKLKFIYNPWWFSGMVEGEGSLQINNRLQTVFEFAQKYDKFAVYGLHKLLNISANVKVRNSDGYTTLSTKSSVDLEKIMTMLKGKMLGVKSFEYRVWCYAHNTNLVSKKLRAREVLKNLREKKIKRNLN